MFFRFCIVILIICSCSKQQSYDHIKVIGHAATGLNMLNSVYHDNSKEGVEYALSMEGCEGIEIDIQLSSDGNLWLYHDVNLNSETNGEGCIASIHSDALKTIRYTTFAKEALVALEDLNFSLFKGKELFLDIRHTNDCTASFVPVASVISKLNALNFNTVQDFKVICLISNPDWIEPLLNSGYTVYFSIYSLSDFNYYSVQFPNIEGFVVKNSEISYEEIKTIKSASKKVYIFEIRSPKGIRNAFGKNPDGLITDDIRATLIEKY